MIESYLNVPAESSKTTSTNDLNTAKRGKYNLLQIETMLENMRKVGRDRKWNAR